MSPAAGPGLLSAALLVRDDASMLLVQHPVASPFAPLWTMPLTGVTDAETAEEALERLLRGTLHVEPGAYDFLDTIYVTAAGGQRFIANVFSCTGWQGDPQFASDAIADAAWVPAGQPGTLPLVPEVRDWFLAAAESEDGVPARGSFDPATSHADLVEARRDLIAAFDRVPHGARTSTAVNARTAVDVLALAADVEAHTLGEIRRCLAGENRPWRDFDIGQWWDARRLRGIEVEATARAILEAAREETRAWLAVQDADTLAVYVNHPERGVVQIGDRLAVIANHDRERADELRRIAQAADAARDGGPGHAAAHR